MTTLREAAQQALEAMRRAECAAVRNGWAGWDGAVSALRAALAEQSDWPICHHCGQMMHPEPLRREHE